MDIQKTIKKLEYYEQEAFNEGFGSDWLSDIGEDLRFYFIECHDKEITPSLQEFLYRIDKKAKDTFED
ncbi:hypothetical protein ABD91_00830 [Lysinibacillus sphaericus]|uniref:hypothetical protein n=1 Tax=Lysinibacillus sphaericus TaxID=1421 RepID=UPI0018CF9A28|nr:hypothetical protein [Lysinibacillus sphaericus]MBG9689471.1 hypothetical protein [Lysinibacillus sphaericus]